MPFDIEYNDDEPEDFDDRAIREWVLSHYPISFGEENIDEGLNQLYPDMLPVRRHKLAKYLFVQWTEF